MGFIESLVGFVIVTAFVLFIWAKIYSHEKDNIDPIIKKIKGWFINDDTGTEFFDPTADFEIAYKGQT